MRNRFVRLSGTMPGAAFLPRGGKDSCAGEHRKAGAFLPDAPLRYRELSGGQQQRVLPARALCATRKLQLLDEPVSGLDPKVTEELYGMIERLNREDGITIIMISHDISAVLKYASHILHIGNRVFYGTKQSFQQSRSGKTFLSEGSGKA